MNEKYQLYPTSVKALAEELNHAIDDYDKKKIDSNELKHLLIHWNSISGNKFLIGPEKFNPTITQRVGAKRLEIVKHLLSQKSTEGNNSGLQNLFSTQSLIIMVGFQLSGKSTIAKKVAGYAPRISLVSLDTLRIAIHGKQFSKKEEPIVWTVAPVMVKTLLLDGFTVIVDATNLSRKERKRWSDLAQDQGVRFAIFHIDTPAEICRQRNRQVKRLEESDLINAISRYEPLTNTEGTIFTLNVLQKELFQ